MHRTALILATLLGHAAQADTCIENADTVSLYLTVEVAGNRVAGWVEPGVVLCVADAGTGPATVAAFLAPDVFEGCSRRVPSGVTERLDAYLGVDNCRWSRPER